jgi:hypothetical protein
MKVPIVNGEVIDLVANLGWYAKERERLRGGDLAMMAVQNRNGGRHGTQAGKPVNPDRWSIDCS